MIPLQSFASCVERLSRQIRNERENCCDDLALFVVGSGVDSRHRPRWHHPPSHLGEGYLSPPIIW